MRDRLPLFVTHCSAEKNGAGDPLTLYTSPRIQRFGKACASIAVPWGVVSARYGLFLWNERHEAYDTELSFSGGQVFVFEKGQALPRVETLVRVQGLVDTIRSRSNELGVHQVVFYVGGAPQRIPAYLLIMHHAIDACRNEHRRPTDVLACIGSASNLRIANGLPELEKELTSALQESIERR